MGQPLDHLGPLARLGRHLVHGLDHLLEAHLALIRRALCLLGGVGGVVGVGGHLLADIGHLLHRGQHLLHLSLVMLQVGVGLAGDAVGIPCVAMDLARGFLHVPEQHLQLVDEAVDAAGQCPQLVLGTSVQALGEIPLAIGDVIYQADHLADGAGDAAGDRQHGGQGQHKYDEGTDELLGHGGPVHLGELALQLIGPCQHHLVGKGDDDGPVAGHARHRDGHRDAKRLVELLALQLGFEVLLPAIAEQLVGAAAEQAGIAAGAGDDAGGADDQGLALAVIDVAVEGLGLTADGVHRQIERGYALELAIYHDGGGDGAHQHLLAVDVHLEGVDEAGAPLPFRAGVVVVGRIAEFVRVALLDGEQQIRANVLLVAIEVGDETPLVIAAKGTLACEGAVLAIEAVRLEAREGAI
ncbi:hypothetical protein D3C79_531360 [compost metagenome]